MASSLAGLFGAVFPSANNTTTRSGEYGPIYDQVGSPDALVGNFAWPSQADVTLGEQYGTNGNEFTGTAANSSDLLPLIAAAADGLIQSGLLITATDHDTPSNPSYAVTQTMINAMPDPVTGDADAQAIIDTINSAIPRNGEPYRTSSAAGPDQDVVFTQ